MVKVREGRDGEGKERKIKSKKSKRKEGIVSREKEERKLKG